MPTLRKRIVFMSDEEWHAVRDAARYADLTMSAVMRRSIDVTVPSNELRDAWFDDLRRGVEALPAHTEDGYDIEWRCSIVQVNSRAGDCLAPEQHNDEMISRSAVAALLDRLHGAQK